MAKFRKHFPQQVNEEKANSHMIARIAQPEAKLFSSNAKLKARDIYLLKATYLEKTLFHIGLIKAILKMIYLN